MKEIIIEIRAGMANVVQKPVGVEIIIRDFDVQEDENTETDENGDAYIEEFYGLSIEY